MANRLGTPAGVLLVSSVFAAIGWLVTYTVENVVSVPAISYFEEISDAPNTDNSQPPPKQFKVKITNLSRDHKFAGLQFLMRLPAKGSTKFVGGKIVPIAPAYSERDPINTSDHSVNFTTVTLHPGTSMTLIGEFRRGDDQQAGEGVIAEPTLHVGAASSRVRLLESGLLTWVIRNELGILLVLLVSWMIVVGIALFGQFGERKNGTPQSNKRTLSINGTFSIDRADVEALRTFSLQGDVSVSDAHPAPAVVPGANKDSGAGNHSKPSSSD